MRLARLAAGGVEVCARSNCQFFTCAIGGCIALPLPLPLLLRTYWS